MRNYVSENCQNCGSITFKQWRDLTDDEKFIVKKILGNKVISDGELKKHRFCGRCFYLIGEEENTA